MFLLCRVGEAQIPANEIGRFQAGEAVWKILCPPANCADRGSKWLRIFSDHGLSQPFSRQRDQTKPSKTYFEGSQPTYHRGCPSGVGYHPFGSPTNLKRNFPADITSFDRTLYSGKFALELA